jgi:sensor histidine kinase regulating citrate/malate metabolism
MSREIEIILDSTDDGMIAIDADGAVTLFNRARSHRLNDITTDGTGLYVSAWRPIPSLVSGK